jgi:hypothetical protein
MTINNKFSFNEITKLIPNELMDPNKIKKISIKWEGSWVEVGEAGWF